MAYDTPDKRQDTWGHHHPRMSRADRARQFMPFAAVSGVREANDKQEDLLLPRPVLSEDQAALLDAALSQLHPGDRVQVCYFRCAPMSNLGTFASVSDVVHKLDEVHRVLKLENSWIRLEDLLSLEVQNIDIRKGNNVF